MKPILIIFQIQIFIVFFAKLVLSATTLSQSESKIFESLERFKNKNIKQIDLSPFNDFNSILKKSNEHNNISNKDQNINWEGWIKYCSFYAALDQNIDMIIHDLPFFKNTYYLAEKQKSFIFNNTVDDYIPDDTSFYLVLHKNGQISISNSKLKKESMIYDSLDISNVKEIYNNKTNSGIRNLPCVNNMTCYQINEITNRELVICLEDKLPASKLISLIKNKKIEQLKKDGKYAYFLANNIMLNKNDVDPYWKVLQDWSTCTVKCGGGTQTLQRICMKSKTSNLDCKGKNILTRECNTISCEDYNNSQNIPSLTPIVKTMQLTTRYQKYIVSNILIYL